MEWILRSPEIHSTFGSLGYFAADGYHINEDCNVALETILHNLTTEDKYLRSYRRSISFGQYIGKDIIPLLTHTSDPKTLQLLIKVLVNLTIPVECLMSVDIICKTEFGRHTMFEINNLLTETKAAFTDQRVTKVLIDFLRSNIELEQSSKLSWGQCVNISNSLLLLRNILHSAETPRGAPAAAGAAEAARAVQNQLLWTIFSQSVDKVLIKLMNIPEAGTWCVSMVQLVALLYREQHTATLHKLLDGWMDASLSDSSEDNESNTSRQTRGSEDSSQMLTSDPTSSNDSSDVATGGSGCDNSGDNSGENGNVSGDNGINSGDNSSEIGDEPNSAAVPAPPHPPALPPPAPPPPAPPPHAPPPHAPPPHAPPPHAPPPHAPPPHAPPRRHAPATKRKHDEGSSSSGEARSSQHKSGISDCGYATQLENQGCASSTSSEDYEPRRIVHVKRRHPKQKPNTKLRAATAAGAGAGPQGSAAAAGDRKRRRIVKRAKTTIFGASGGGSGIGPVRPREQFVWKLSINVHGLACKAPTDEDISIVLKEFTVDFLLHGFNSLVRSLHRQIVSDAGLEIDKAHLFWLVTYFLKFAMQIEVGAEKVRDVLSFEFVAYLAAEGAALAEDFLLAQRLDGQVLNTSVRRMHLLVTAIRETVQAVELYARRDPPAAASSAGAALAGLRAKICDSEELRLLLVMLLRQYDRRYHTKQYLQDLVVTNHILILFIESVVKLPHYKGRTSIRLHVEQFANAEMMFQYATLLEDFFENGEYVNDCVFNMMHHVSGDLGCLISLFQPKILRTFNKICDSEYEICDEWNDLIQYVMNTFVKKPFLYPDGSVFGLKEAPVLDDEQVFVRPAPPSAPAAAPAAPPRAAPRTRPPPPPAPPALRAPAARPAQKWTETELSTLRWHFMQCTDSSEVIGDVVDIYREDGITKSRESVLQELHNQRIVNVDLFERLTKGETDRSKQIGDDEIARGDEIRQLCEKLARDGKLKFLEWLQKLLLDACYAKTYLERQATNVANEATTRPANSKIYTFTLFKKKQVDLPLISAVAYHSMLVGKSVPLVPWSLEQDSICHDSRFLQLLHKLGFQMPADTGRLYARIPNRWTTYQMYEVAGKILPIHDDLIKKDILFIPTPEDKYQIQKPSNTMLNFTPIPGMSYHCGELAPAEPTKPSWLDIVKRSNQLKITLDSLHSSPEELASTTRSTELVPPVMCGARVALASPLTSSLDGRHHSPTNLQSRERATQEPDKPQPPPALLALPTPCAPDIPARARGPRVTARCSPAPNLPSKHPAAKSHHPATKQDTPKRLEHNRKLLAQNTDLPECESPAQTEHREKATKDAIVQLNDWPSKTDLLEHAMFAIG